MLWLRRGFLEQAAIWAGLLVGNNDVDVPVFEPACQELEAALGAENYRHALEQGQSLTLDGIVSEGLHLLN